MSDHDPRVTKHLEGLVQSGSDLQKFVAALDAIRTDLNLPTAGRTALLKTLAMEQALGYLSAVSGKQPNPAAIKAPGS